jgi:hypothetical protein
MLERSGALRYFCLTLRLPGEIVFEIWMAAAQTIFTDLVGLRWRLGNEEASVVTAFPADDLRTV